MLTSADDVQANDTIIDNDHDQPVHARPIDNVTRLLM